MKLKTILMAAALLLVAPKAAQAQSKLGKLAGTLLNGGSSDAGSIAGDVVGDLLGNLLGGAVLPDVVFGSLATLIGAVGTRMLCKKSPVLAVVPPIVSN
ncbi:MAG: QueT transporter family protein, partial [Bacteroidaceae bacterium]|nr:QueT transporter family protein [Bacteroidaceae bacterium]